MESQQIVEKGNIGEKSEVSTKKLLFNNKENVEFLVPIFGSEASAGIEILDHKSIPYIPYTNADQIEKAPPGWKADVIILFISTNRTRFCSMKSKIGAKPSLVNTTARSAKVFQGGCLQAQIQNLDLLLAEYIKKRTDKVFKEDVKFEKFEVFKEETIKNSFEKMLSYFVFKGTGKGLSKKECDSILITNKDNTLTFIDCDTEEKKENYVRSIADTCDISLRSSRNKGMSDKAKSTGNCPQWIYVDNNGKQCCNLNIRLNI